MGALDAEATGLRQGKLLRLASGVAKAAVLHRVHFEDNVVTNKRVGVYSEVLPSGRKEACKDLKSSSSSLRKLAWRPRSSPARWLETSVGLTLGWPVDKHVIITFKLPLDLNPPSPPSPSRDSDSFGHGKKRRRGGVAPK